MDDVKNMSMTGVKIPTVKDLPVIQLNNTSNIDFKNIQMPVCELKGISKTNYK